MSYPVYFNIHTQTWRKHVPCVSEFWKKFKWSWIMKLEEKISFSFGSFKILLFFLWKVVSHFCNFQVFLPTNAPKRSAIANDRPLYATLRAQVVHPKHLQLVIYRVHSKTMLVFFHYVIEYWYNYDPFGKVNVYSALFRSFLNL